MIVNTGNSPYKTQAIPWSSQPKFLPILEESDQSHKEHSVKVKQKEIFGLLDRQSGENNPSLLICKLGNEGNKTI